jgi:hypothetical protein
VRKSVQPSGSSACISDAKRSRGLVTERIVLVATRGRIELAVPQQDLDHTDIDILFQQTGEQSCGAAYGATPAS